MNVLAWLRERLQQALADLSDDPAADAQLVRPAQDPKFGHYQINAAMPLAKKLGRSPRDVAAEIAGRLDVAEVCEKPQIAGPGFINLCLRTDWLASHLGLLVQDERLGVPLADSPRTYVIDYSSPNVAKPMHVGHLRSTVIGDCLYRVLNFLGHRVISDNHLGDWGTQFGMILVGYKRFLDPNAYAQNPVQELSRLYRLVNQISEYQLAKAELAELHRQWSQRQPQGRPSHPKEQEHWDQLQHTVRTAESDPTLVALAREHPDLAEAARQETVKLHAGDPENRRLWESFLPPCLKAIDQVYQRLGVRFDNTLGESFYDPMLPHVVADLQQRGLAQESEGALCVLLGGSMPPCIVRKSDGAYTYATTDLATIQYRIETFHPDAILYVVGQPQALHFQQVFEVAHRWGCRNVELTHVSFGSVLGEDGRPFRTRAGDTVGLESLLDEAVERARQQYQTSRESRRDRGEEVPDLPPDEQQRIAEAVGIGAIKYADLSQNRTSDYVFSWEKMLAMEGNTATYMQYAYARVCSIFRKGNVSPEEYRSAPAPLALSHPAEEALAVALVRFPEVLEAVAAEFRPNILTVWLFELANRFSTFYNSCPVLKAPDESLRRSRLALCDLTSRALEKGLELLGIHVMPQM